MTYVLESNLSDRRLLLAKLEEILADRRNPYLWSHNLYKEIHSASSAGMTQDIAVCGAVE